MFKRRPSTLIIVAIVLVVIDRRVLWGAGAGGRQQRRAEGLRHDRSHDGQRLARTGRQGRQVLVDEGQAVKTGAAAASGWTTPC